MSDNNLENLMTENTNIEDNTTLNEETVTEEIATTEEVTTETLETETTVEEVVETEPAVEEETPTVVEEQATEDTAAVEEEVTTEEMPDVTEEVVVMEETVTTEEVQTEPAVDEETTEELVTTEEVTTEETAEEVSTPVEEQATQEVSQTETNVEEVAATEVTTEVTTEATTEVAPKKEPFKLTPPENNEELFEKMCVKRGRKLIYAPKEVIYDASFTVLGTNKKNEEGIRIKDILEAEIKEGTRLGYLDKYDGLKSSEIKEEYENDIIYEYAEQEFKKMGIIFDGKKLKVYVYDWDGKACHHVGFIDETAAADSIKYFSDKENYSFDLCGIITGGKGKRVTKNENGKLTITKEKGGDYGIELDISVIARKD